MQIKDYIRPGSLAEAYEKYQKGESILFAGGTDLMVKAKEKNPYKDKIFLDISQLSELKKIEFAPQGTVRISSAITLQELLEEPRIKEAVPLLWQAVSHVANTQVRNRATLAGNLANACPASDCIPALMVLRAEVLIGDGNKTRTARIQDLFQDCKACLRHRDMLVRTCFYADPRIKKLTLQPGEIIEAIELPFQKPDEHSCFIKLTPNRSSDMATLNLAMTGGLDEKGCIKSVDFCMGGAFPRPVCHKEMEADLVGRLPEKKLLEEYAQKAGALLDGAEKLLADFSYKRQAAPGLVLEGLISIFLQGGQGL